MTAILVKPEKFLRIGIDGQFQSVLNATPPARVIGFAMNLNK
jgi:hypothetical protein